MLRCWVLGRVILLASNQRTPNTQPVNDHYNSAGHSNHPRGASGSACQHLFYQAGRKLNIAAPMNPANVTRFFSLALITGYGYWRSLPGYR
ncbi:hypothetical protein D0Y50_05735 [Salinimonas sediminis]|uniref:Uncharacterized protein n=1 Tax=Salinimonas sediminis TaxID=2303538 RepID=A0A346NK67_9ALTE|nr:hypothetical protein D0Y50_05735 [Salinimonas sediminis]